MKLKNSKYQFSKVSKEHPLYNETQWYYSLALIKQDSLDKAKNILNTNFSIPRKEKVKKLLNQLK